MFHVMITWEKKIHRCHYKNYLAPYGEKGKKPSENHVTMTIYHKATFH